MISERHRNTRAGALAGLLAVIFFSIAPARAAAPAEAAEPVDVQADRLEYDGQDAKFLIGIGHVVVKQHGHTLKADYVQVNTETQDVFAKGNIELTRPDGTVMKGEEGLYNFKTQIGTFGQFDLVSKPFYVYGQDVEKSGQNEVKFRRLILTTCEGEKREFEIRARDATLRDSRYLEARHAVVYLGAVPVFYFPRLTKDLQSAGNFDFMPGYSSRMGAFLLGTYTYKPRPDVRSITRFDYRTARGFGGGQDFEWKGTNQMGRGFFRSYYASDNDPTTSRDTPEEEALVDSSRYRLRLAHAQSMSPKDTFYADVSYLSDPFVLEDFFRREYRESPQPENRVSWTRAESGYTAGLMLNKRLNDFYNNVDRLPELTLDVYRRPIGESPFYYESANSFSLLTRVFPDQDDTDEYESLRLDSGHKVYYPTRHFGFLSVTPRAGYRATYYSKTRETSTVTNMVTTVDANGVSTTAPQAVTLEEDAGSELRHVYQLGLESSFKAFKVLDEGGNYLGEGLRHVAEPYVDYTYQPEPNIRPAQLYQFDEIDEVDLDHSVLFGMRNKMQTRLGRGIHDFVDFNLYTAYRVEKTEEQNDLDPVYFDMEFRPSEWFAFDFEGQYDTETSALQDLHAQGTFIARDDSRFSVTYLYRDQSRSLLASNLTLFPNEKWSYDMYHRYEFETSTLEEQMYSVRRRLNCIGLGLGFSHEAGYNQDDDFKVWLQIWLLAFPNSSVSLGG